MKSHGYKIILMICATLSLQNVFGQWDANTTMGENALEITGMGHQDDIQAIEDRKLILMVLEEDPKMINKWRKTGDTTLIVEYRNAINSFNQDFINAVDTYWPFHHEHIQLGYDSIQHMDKLVKPEYAVIYFARYEIYIEGGEVKTKTSYDINWDGHIIGTNVTEPKNRSAVDYYTVMKIAKVEEFRRTPPVQVSMPHVVPTKIDLAFGLSYSSWYMNQKMRGSKDVDLRKNLDDNSVLLSKLTLVINSDDVKQGIIDDPYAASYPFSFNVLPAEMYDAIVNTKMSGYAYVVMNCGKICVIRAEDGEPLYISRLFDWNALIGFKDMGKQVGKLVKGK